MSLLLIPALLLVFLTSAMAGDGKIPITTKSEKAKEYFLKGRDLSEKLRFNDAREFFRKAVQADPDFAIAWQQMSATEPSAKEFFDDHNKAYDLKDKVTEGERLQIEIQRAQIKGEAKTAEELGMKLAAMFPQDERAQNLMGNLLFGQQKYQDAIAYYNKAVSINPKFSQPYNQLGYANRFLENYLDAEKAFKQYIKLIPDDPNPYDSYAELLMKMGEFKKSIDYYEDALKLNSTFIASHLGIATNYNFLGQHKDARRQLKKLLEVAEDNGQRRAAHFTMAVSYADQGDFTRAIEELNTQLSFAESIDDYNNMAGDFVTMGNVYLEAGDNAKAMELFNKSLEYALKSNVSDLVKDNARRLNLYNTGRAALADLDISTAKQKAAEFKKQTEAVNNPNQIKLAHELLGTIAIVEGEYQTAVAELNQANLQDPYDLYRLAVAYKGMGNDDKAGEYYDKAKNFNALNSFNQAFVRAKSGNLNTASL